MNPTDEEFNHLLTQCETYYRILNSYHDENKEQNYNHILTEEILNQLIEDIEHSNMTVDKLTFRQISLYLGDEKVNLIKENTREHFMDYLKQELFFKKLNSLKGRINTHQHHRLTCCQYIQIFLYIVIAFLSGIAYCRNFWTDPPENVYSPTLPEQVPVPTIQPEPSGITGFIKKFI